LVDLFEFFLVFLSSVKWRDISKIPVTTAYFSCSYRELT